MTKLNHSLVRCLAFALAVLLCVGMLPAKASAETVNTFVRAEDMSEPVGLKPEDTGFWGQESVKRSWVSVVEFHNTTEGAPRNYFDFSAAHNKSILGWYDNGTMHLAADGKITLNKNASWMFAFFTNLREIRFNGCVDTTGVTDMTGLFFCCTKLQELDVSFFDTSAVTSMNRMFGHCELVKTLDVAGFDTAKVNDFSFMFFSDRGLTDLNVSGFNTSSALYMPSMFYHCENLKTIDDSNFDYSHVITNVFMFSGCNSLGK